MSALLGNPYDDSATEVIEAYVFSADGEPQQNIEFLLHDLVQAQRAANYEQRTANLIAVTETLTVRARFDEVQVNELLDQISARLGLNPKEGTS